ncbi:MAG: Ig-like domain-containing protein [Peptococcaceae bacterium MAG4]|nr:Ig-like domain-containing protein [Peptococcaceae bacterium MAG4]
MTSAKRTMQFWLWLLVACFAFLAFLPASIGQAAEVRDLRAYFDQLDSRGGDWNKNSNNDYGLLAFREAYVLQSYLLMYETYKDTRYLDKFVDHADSVLKQRDNIRKVTDYRGLSLPAWRHTDPPNDSNPLILGGKFYHVAVDTGNISYPYAWFARLVKNDPGLSAYNSKADIYLQAAKDAISVHEDEWRESGGAGYYIYRKGSPYWCDGVGVPHNQNLGLARTMLNIYLVTGETKYLDRVTKIARHFKNNLTLEGDRYVWYYWWGLGYTGWTSSQKVSVNTPNYGGYKKYEDFRHGAVDGDFVAMAYQAGIVFDETDMQRFANTIGKNIIRSDGKINETVSSVKLNGSNDILIGLWLRFNDRVPTLFDATYQRASNYTSVGAPGLLVVAYMNWAYNGPGSGKQPPTPPPPQDTTPPQVEIVQPAGGAALDLQVSVAASATDDTGVVGVDFEYSLGADGPWTALASGVKGEQNWTANWSTRNMPDGTYYLRAVARDAAGNTGNSAAVAVTISGRTTPAPGEGELVINGDFSRDREGWSAGGSMETEITGNKYAANNYNWQLYQDLQLQPGDYTLNALTKKMTGSEARICVFYIDDKGNRTLDQDTRYTIKGAGWEEVPEIKFSVPASAATTRIYLLSVDTSTVGFDNISLRGEGTDPGTGDDDVPEPGDGDNEEPEPGDGDNDNPGPGDGEPEPGDGEQSANLVINGDFSRDKQGWSAGGSIATEGNGNKYAVNDYNWQLYQDLRLQPGDYSLQAQVKKGTGSEARICVFYIDDKGNRTLNKDIRYTIKGAGWEEVPEIKFSVPASAATTRIYLLSPDTKTVGFDNISLRGEGTDPGTGDDDIPGPGDGDNEEPEPGDGDNDNPGPGDGEPEPGDGEQSANLVINGDFSRDKQGWSAGGSIATEGNGNKYAVNDYNWQLYQDLRLQPGNYSLQVQTKKGTGSEARICVFFIDSKGNRTLNKDIRYTIKGAGWEEVPEIKFSVPASAATTRIYLLSPDTKTVGFDNITLKQTGSAPGNGQPANLVTNGDFSLDKQGWSAGGSLKTEANGNKYVSNSYNWQLYQDLRLQPGKEYKLSALTRRGTAKAADARVAVAFIDKAGVRTVAYDFRYRHKGTGWEAIPEQTIKVPAGAVITRIYLLSATESGYHDFDNIVLTQ